MIRHLFFLATLVAADLNQAIQAALQTHNSLRARHEGTGPLVLADDLNIAAQAWAEHMLTTDNMAHAPADQRPNQGENLAWSMSSAGIDLVQGTVDGVIAWYNEIRDYDWSEHEAHTGVIGHFTQLVWVDSTELGIGAVLSADGTQIYVVARYRNPGNYIGRFANNVKPLIDSSVVGVGPAVDDGHGSHGGMGGHDDSDGGMTLEVTQEISVELSFDAAGQLTNVTTVTTTMGPYTTIDIYINGVLDETVVHDNSAGHGGTRPDGSTRPDGTDHDGTRPDGTERDPFVLDKDCDDATFDDAKIMCNTNMIGLKIPRCAFRNAHLRAAYLGMYDGDEPDETCAGVAYDDYMVFAVNGTNCGTEVIKNETHLIYINHVAAYHGSSNNVISRRKTLRLDFQCEILNEVVIGLDQAIQPLATNVQIDMGTKQTSFNLRMGLFNSNFTRPLPFDAEIVVPQMLNIELETTQLDDDSNFRLQARECWATPSESSDDELHYMFIENFCGNADDMGDDALFVEGNGEGSSVQISLQSFQFVDEPNADIFIHCRAVLCNADTDADGCVHTCGNVSDGPLRKRRSARAIPVQQKTDNIHIAVGPIRVTKY